MPNPPCTSGDGREAEFGWQRIATQTEIDHFHEIGELPLTETTALVMVYACPLHQLPGDLAARDHQSVCTAPGTADSDHATCDCNQARLVRSDLEARLAAVIAAIPTGE